jgi:4'-phosphopantetheinyl transferase
VADRGNSPTIGVNVWWARRSPDRAISDRAASDFTREERVRLASLRQASDRHTYLAAHSLLRHALSVYTGVATQRIGLRFQCVTCGGQHGKPYVPGGPHFSLAHAGDVILIAVTKAGPVGIDVEQVGATSFAGFDAVALSSAERTRVAETPAAVRARARTNWWVRKEAVLKATGHGLTIDPAHLEVSGPDEDARLTGWSAAEPAPEDVKMADLTLPQSASPEECLACIAVLSRAPMHVELIDATGWLTEREAPVRTATR